MNDVLVCAVMLSQWVWCGYASACCDAKVVGVVWLLGIIGIVFVW